MASILFPLYAVAHALLVAWFIHSWRASPKPEIRCAAAIALIVSLGLVYDNGLVAIGASIGLGELLQSLSMPRYYMHALFTPMMLFAMLQICAAAGFEFAQKSALRWAAGILAVVLIPVGIYEDLVGLKLFPACYEGTVRYASRLYENSLCDAATVFEPATSGGPPIPAITVVFVVLILGGLLAIKRRSPWVFLGGVIMYIGAAMPVSKFGPSPGNGAEVFFSLGFALAIARFAKRPEDYR